VSYVGGCILSTVEEKRLPSIEATYGAAGQQRRVRTSLNLGRRRVLHIQHSETLDGREGQRLAVSACLGKAGEQLSHDAEARGTGGAHTAVPISARARLTVEHEQSRGWQRCTALSSGLDGVPRESLGVMQVRGGGRGHACSLARSSVLPPLLAEEPSRGHGEHRRANTSSVLLPDGHRLRRRVNGSTCGRIVLYCIRGRGGELRRQVHVLERRAHLRGFERGGAVRVSRRV